MTSKGSLELGAVMAGGARDQAVGITMQNDRASHDLHLHEIFGRRIGRYDLPPFGLSANRLTASLASITAASASLSSCSAVFISVIAVSTCRYASRAAFCLAMISLPARLTRARCWLHVRWASSLFATICSSSNFDCSLPISAFRSLDRSVRSLPDADAGGREHHARQIRLVLTIAVAGMAAIATRGLPGASFLRRRFLPTAAGKPLGAAARSVPRLRRQRPRPPTG